MQAMLQVLTLEALFGSVDLHLVTDRTSADYKTFIKFHAHAYTHQSNLLCLIFLRHLADASNN